MKIRHFFKYVIQKIRDSRQFKVEPCDTAIQPRPWGSSVVILDDSVVVVWREVVLPCDPPGRKRPRPYYQFLRK
jgi:hypothetical protein